VQFNNSIVLLEGYDIYSAIRISVTGQLEPYNVSWYLRDADFYFAGVADDQFNIVLDWLDT